TSTAANQFLIRAAGGVGINTTTPGAALGINGRIRIINTTDNKNYELAYDSTGHFFYIDEYGVDHHLVIQSGNGYVGIGTWVPASKPDVNGVIRATGGFTTSDARYKQNIVSFPDALNTVLNLRGVTFDWKKNDYPNMNFAEGRQIGFIAQEV